MKTKRNLYYGFALTLLVGLLFVYFNLVPILGFIAENFLAVHDEPQNSDVIIAISGGFCGERIEKAIELYNKGYARKMIFSGGLITKDISTVDLWLKRVQKLGVAPEDIFLHRDSTSTFENALYSAKIMDQEQYKSAILVTSPYHSRRAKMVFSKVFDKKAYSIIVVPVERKKSLPDEDKSRRIDIVVEEVFFELQKLLFYIIAY